MPGVAVAVAVGIGGWVYRAEVKVGAERAAEVGGGEGPGAGVVQEWWEEVPEWEGKRWLESARFRSLSARGVRGAGGLPAGAGCVEEGGQAVGGAAAVEVMGRGG